MDPKLTFVFYLAALVCFVLAFLSGRSGAKARLSRVATGGGLVPLGLACWLFPTFWDAATRAF